VHRSLKRASDEEWRGGVECGGGDGWRFEQATKMRSLVDRALGGGKAVSSAEEGKASWLLMGMEAREEDSLLSGIGFMGVCSRNPDVYNAPKPIHSHVFHRGMAKIEGKKLERLRRSRFNLPPTSSSLPAGGATTAPKSNIWRPVVPLFPARNEDEYWDSPPTGII